MIRTTESLTDYELRRDAQLLEVQRHKSDPPGQCGLTLLGRRGPVHGPESDQSQDPGRREGG
eukprot:5027545-Pyramimonas_sp.AAC.2